MRTQIGKSWAGCSDAHDLLCACYSGAEAVVEPQPPAPLWSEFGVFTQSPAPSLVTEKLQTVWDILQQNLSHLRAPPATFGRLQPPSGASSSACGGAAQPAATEDVPDSQAGTRTLQITRVSGEQLVLVLGYDVPDDAAIYDIMLFVKGAWGVPMREQTLCADAEVLAPRQAIGDDRVCLTLVRKRPSCGHCHRRWRRGSRRLLLCGRCLVVQYCGPACQSNDWHVHKLQCWSEEQQF